MVAPDEPFDTELAYAEACNLACQGQHDEAWLVYMELKRAIASWEKGAKLRALIHNDLAVLAAMDGQFDEARAGWQTALEIDRDCLVARLNRDLVEAEINRGVGTEDVGELKIAATEPDGARLSERIPAHGRPQTSSAARSNTSLSCAGRLAF